MEVVEGDFGKPLKPLTLRETLEAMTDKLDCSEEPFEYVVMIASDGDTTKIATNGVPAPVAVYLLELAKTTQL